MDSERFKRIKKFFHAAADLDLKERSAYLDQVCQGDPELRHKIDRLLAADEPDVGSRKPRSVQGPPAGGAADRLIDTHVGQYHITDVIASGGMGTVYEAKQEKPRRRVALKVLKAGLASTQALRRFTNEAEILGRLQHPYIAQVFEAGMDESAGGLPFFAMEFIPNAKQITHYVREEHLSIHQKLELFAKICDAVHFGHQHGVIHRDLKPGNILIGEGGQPKLIDFGVARMTDADMTIATQQTDIGQLIGTLRYMSPEQCEGDSNQIDARCDVYGLGVVLYEILCGQLPYDLASTTAFEIPRVIREEEPRKLSSINRALRGDVETIVLKALEKDRTRRYQSAVDLGQDIRRYLNKEPILAMRDRRWYILKKTLSRHKLAAGIASSFMLLVITSAVVLGIMYQKSEEKAEALRVSTYFNIIALAQNAYESANAVQLKELLNQCPEDLRGWEWFYLKNLSDESTMTLRGHEGMVIGIDISPDGTRIVSGGGDDDNTVRVWDAHTGRVLHTLSGHQYRVQCVAFSPDGKRIVTGSYDQTLRVWDAATGEMLLELKGHGEIVSHAAFTPDGERILSGDGKGNMKVWDAVTGGLLMDLAGHERGICSLAVSPDGAVFASGGDLISEEDNYIKLWDAESGRELRSIPGHDHRVTGLAFSEDGRRLYSGSWDKYIKAWDAESGELLMTFVKHGTDINDLALAPSRPELAVSGNTGVRIFSTESGEPIRMLLGHDHGRVHSIRYSPDGSRIISGAADGTIKIWDAVQEQSKTLLGRHEGIVESVTCSPDGRWIASAGRDGIIKVYDARTDREITALSGHELHVKSLVFSPDGRRLVSGGTDHSARVWDIPAGKERLELKAHEGTVQAVAWSPDSTLIATGSLDHAVVIWVADTGKPVRSITNNEEVLSVNFSPDSKKLVTGTIEGTVSIWDVLSGELVERIAGHSNGARAVLYSPDGERIISCGMDFTRIWNVRTHQAIHELRGQENLLDVALSPDGRRIVSASSDCILKVWDTATGQLALTLRGHEYPVNSVAFTPDGRRIISGSHDTTVRTWNAGRRDQ